MPIYKEILWIEFLYAPFTLQAFSASQESLINSTFNIDQFKKNQTI
jgi:hypothetical protein